MILTKLIGLIIFLIVCIILFKAILAISGTLLKVTAHLLVGWFLLAIVRYVLGIYIPVNLITLLISGFGGVFGTFILVLIYVL